MTVRPTILFGLMLAGALFGAAPAPAQRLHVDTYTVAEGLPSSAILEIGQDPSGIVETILSLGKNLGLTVIAEGIETDAQPDRLRQLGCDLGQGYQLGRPMAADDTVNKIL